MIGEYLEGLSVVRSSLLAVGILGSVAMTWVASMDSKNGGQPDEVQEQRHLFDEDFKLDHTC